MRALGSVLALLFLSGFPLRAAAQAPPAAASPSTSTEAPAAATPVAPAATATPAAEALPPGYRDATARAIREFDLGNYAEARAAFRQAHALYPNARTLRGLGKAEFELKNYRACIEYLEQALASDERRLDGALRTDAMQLLQQAQTYVARYAIETNPGQAHVMLDGQTIELGEGNTLVVEVGDHVLEVQAAGYQRERMELRVSGGKQEVLRVRLRKLPKAGSDSIWGKWWVWTAIGVGIAGAATGVALAMGGEEKVDSPEEGNVGSWGTVTAVRGPAIGTW